MLTTIHVTNINSKFLDFLKVGRPDSKEDGLDSDTSFEYLWIKDKVIISLNTASSISI